MEDRVLKRLNWVLAGVALLTPAFAQTVTVTPNAPQVHIGTFLQFAARVKPLNLKLDD